MLDRLRNIVCLLLLVASPVLAADASDRKFIREGMSEGEVLMKIGKPDYDSVDSGGGASVSVRRWVYLPTSGDPQTITTLVIRNGRVEEVKREVAR
jgi:hypothetical protein